MHLATERRFESLRAALIALCTPTGELDEKTGSMRCLRRAARASTIPCTFVLAAAVLLAAQGPSPVAGQGGAVLTQGGEFGGVIGRTGGSGGVPLIFPAVIHSLML